MEIDPETICLVNCKIVTIGALVEVVGRPGHWVQGFALEPGISFLGWEFEPLDETEDVICLPGDQTLDRSLPGTYTAGDLMALARAQAEMDAL
jgi:hypothetical protein